MAKSSFGSPKTSDKHSVQICQLEKDAERTLVLSPQRGRQRAQYKSFMSSCVWGDSSQCDRSLSRLGQRLWHAPLPFTSCLAGGMLLRCSHRRSCCSHSHLLLLHLVLQELQLSGREERGKDRYQSWFRRAGTSSNKNAFLPGFGLMGRGGPRGACTLLTEYISQNPAHNSAKALRRGPVEKPVLFMWCFVHLTPRYPSWPKAYTLQDILTIRRMSQSKVLAVV